MFDVDISKPVGRSIRVRPLAALFVLFALSALFLPPASPCCAAPSRMEAAFWAKDWRTMDELYVKSYKTPPTRSEDVAGSSLSPQEFSLYANALWRRGRYADSLAIFSGIDGAVSDDLRPYRRMLSVLGSERTGRKREAYEEGRAFWESAPEPVRYYLAYAMGRLCVDLELPDEAMAWYRRMLALATDRKRRLQALSRMIDLPGLEADEAATLLIDMPSSAKALAFCRDLPAGKHPRAEYALGYKAYAAKEYETAMKHFALASADVSYGEAARYYHAYAAYREKRDGTAFELWAGIARAGYEYPQRSVQRLTVLANRAKRADILKLFDEVARKREKDYPELAADALVGLIRLGDAEQSAAAEKKLFADHPASNQTATIRWERGWKAWKAGKHQTAYDEWSKGYDPGIANAELASRLLYWQIRALEKLGSPVAASRVRDRMAEEWPGEYHTFLVHEAGGVVSGDVPASCDVRSPLELWGFVTYARLESEAAAALPAASADVADLYRAVRLAHWEGDHASGVRAFAALSRAVSPDVRARSGFLQNAYPRAFPQDVAAAAKKTGLDAAVIWGVMRQESLYEPDVTSVAGAYGLMQLMPATGRSEAKKMGMAEDAYRNPTHNILLGANHLVGLIARFKEHPLAYAAYNAGGSPVTRWSREPIADMAEWVEDIGYRETRGYVKAVMRNVRMYRLLYPEKRAAPASDDVGKAEQAGEKLP